MSEGHGRGLGEAIVYRGDDPQDEIERLQAENAKLRKHAEAMAECKALADGMANMIRGFIFKTVERETLDEMAAKYRKWEEDYCHRAWRAKQ